MTMAKPAKALECVGGPLCGSKRPNMGRFIHVDTDDTPHFYRRIKVCTNDFQKKAVFFHYFGTEIEYASTAEPYLLPGDKVFRPIK